MNFDTVFTSAWIAQFWTAFTSWLYSLIGAYDVRGWSPGWLTPIVFFMLAIPLAFKFVAVALAVIGYEIPGVNRVNDFTDDVIGIATGHGGRVMRRHATEAYSAEHPMGLGTNHYEPNTIPEMVTDKSADYNPYMPSVNKADDLDTLVRGGPDRTGMIDPVPENENTYHPRTVAGEIHDGSGLFRNRA